MQLAISETNVELKDLVRRVEAGEEVVLTRHGQAVARLVAMRERPPVQGRAAVIAAVRANAAAKADEGPNAAQSQDFLYDSDGLPR